MKGGCYKKKGMLTVSLDYDGARRRRERKKPIIINSIKKGGNKITKFECGM